MPAQKNPTLTYSLKDLLSAAGLEVLKQNFHLEPEPALAAPALKYAYGTMPSVLIDACVHPQTGKYLERAGIATADVRKLFAEGTKDEDVFEYARKRDVLLLTHDNDFLDFWRFPLEKSAGIILMPAAGRWDRIPHGPQTCEFIKDTLDQFLEDLPYLAPRRRGVVYDYRFGVAERIDKLNQTRVAGYGL